jgi:N-acetylmuramoyl-L-alanine amidase
VARYPGAAWRPLANDWASQRTMVQHDIICLHTMVGSLWGTDAFFRSDGYGGAESHFGVGYNGETLQWQDTSRQAEANLNGNHRIISIETADYGPGFGTWNVSDASAVPAWTPEQVERIAEIVAWACRTHSIPCELVPDSRPTRRGVAYHRQGIPGWGLVPGGEVWSSARGKVCPGNRRVAQIPLVISRARAILAGSGKGVFMALSDAEQNELLARVRDIHHQERHTLTYSSHHGNAQDNQYGHTLSVRKELTQARAALAATTELLVRLQAAVDRIESRLAAEEKGVSADLPSGLPTDRT